MFVDGPGLEYPAHVRGGNIALETLVLSVTPSLDLLPILER
jgi:hypothetical protein